MEQYLIDTNVVSDYFSELLPEAGMTLIDEVIDAFVGVFHQQSEGQVCV
jgi:hypothetical protein